MATRSACGGASDTGAVLVGRRRELEVLSEALDAASEGRGGLVVLVGEAGVGKTAIARAFATDARAQGASVLRGSCFEGEWQPPYGPWVEALGGYFRATEPEHLQKALGSGTPPLARLVPEVRAALPETPPTATLSPDQERSRLYDAVTQVLLIAARARPVVLVLDDLHWADRDSLWLLRHIVRFAGNSRLMILGIYRDPDLHLRRPLTDVLAVLRRETDYERVVVRGLDYPHVAEYLARAAGQDFPEALTRAIYAETGGNPFYTREVFRHLVEEGKIIHRAGRWSTDFSIGALGIPESVRQVLGRRLSRLSEDANAMLKFAAVLTGGFEFRVLQTLTGLPEEALLDCLDEALRAGLIRATGRADAPYDFAHAIVRHALYEELNPDRKTRLHRRIAEVLERVHAGNESEHAAELASQYHASATLPGAERGIPHALAAAEQARAGYAHERAVTFLRMARDLAVRGRPATRAAILCKLALAEAEALMLAEAQGSVEEALTALSEAGAEPAALAGFLATVSRALKDGGASHTVWEPLVQRGLALVGDRRDLTWARLMLLLDRAEPISRGEINVSRWLGYDPQAVAIARAGGDEDDYARTLEPFDWRAREETDAVLALARSWKRPAAIIRALDVVARDFIFRHGDLREATDRLRELLAAGERYGSIPAQAEALVQLALCEAILGDLPLARQTAGRAHDTVGRLGSMHRLRFAETAVASILAYFLDGDWPALALRAARATADPKSGRGPLGLTAAAFAVFGHNRAGNEAEARRLLEALTPVLERAEPTMYIYNGCVDRAATTVWELAAAELAPRYRRLALDLIAANIGDGPMKTNELIAARMSALLGEMTEAGTYFARARVVLDASGHRPLRAIADHDEALALIRAGSKDTAHVTMLLDAALARFRALGMDGWEKRVHALRESLIAPTRVGADRPDGLTTREVEVLRLIAGGKTSKEIAGALFVSVPTVGRHIANIYPKIGARNRADATAYALSQGIAEARVT